MEPQNFIEHIINEDRDKSDVVTRFPPEPNGYLHIGHAKSICLNFSLAAKYHGRCHLRFDDTNPLAEEVEYIDAIQEDIQWLGFDWKDHLFYASDYFEKLYEFAHQLIDQGLAYVDDSTPEQIKELRGTLTEPGRPGPFRDRSVDENKALFTQMREGKFRDGEKVLRAKIDMASPNMNMRDPLLYRIRHVPHPRLGEKWVIYPLYDFTHPLSDMLEGISHSICTLEFEDHRPLYDWLLEVLKTPCHPQQIEFARLNINYFVMTKRKIFELVEGGFVSGWDDPRMMTLKGLRRRGYTPRSIREFCHGLGVSKKNTVIDMSLLEQAIRADLDEKAPRAMAVLDPIKVTITNLSEDYEEFLTCPVHPKKPEMGERQVPFCNSVYIDAEDFMMDPPKKYFRLRPGGQVRLRYAYVITCNEVISDESGKVIELKCTYDKQTGGGVTPEGQKKVKGIIHWVSARHGLAAEVRSYDRLFNDPNPLADKDRDFKEFLNNESFKLYPNAFLEPSLKAAAAESHFQFERLGFFVADQKDHSTEKPVFNRTVTLRDSWK